MTKVLEPNTAVVRKQYYELTAEQTVEVRLAMAEVRRGEFASDEAVAYFWEKSGV